MSIQINKSNDNKWTNNGNLSKIFTQNTNNSSIFPESVTVKSTKYVPIYIPTKGQFKSVRNRIPKSTNNSYDVWEFTYFQHILNLCDIFKHLTDQLKIDINNFDFLDIFAHFIRDCSSGEISLYIEELSDEVSDLYNDFTILRNT